MRINDMKYDLLSLIDFLLEGKTYTPDICSSLIIYSSMLNDVEHLIVSVVKNIQSEFETEKFRKKNVEKHLIYLKNSIVGTI